MAFSESEITSSFLSLDNINSEAATNALLASGEDLFIMGQKNPTIVTARNNEIEDVKGNELPKTPDFTADLSLHYTTVMPDWVNLRSTVQYTYRSEMQQRIYNNDNADTVPSYDTFNLVFSFKPNKGNWSADLMAMNVTDEDGVNSSFTDVFGVAGLPLEN